MSQYFPKPFKSFGGNINVKVDLSNYATKTDLKNVTHVDTSRFALKTNLANLKTEVERLDIDKLVPVPVDLSQLSDVVKDDVVKKGVYHKLVAKVNNIDTSVFVLKTKYQTDKKGLEKEIPNVANFVKKTKLTELENKIPDVSNLATKTALTVVENKIPSVSNLVKKTDYDTKITELEEKVTDHNHDKYVTTPEFNTLAASVFNARLAQANLITKTDFDTKLSSLNKKFTANITKHFLVENELKKLKTFYSSYFIDKSHFKEDGTQNYLVFQSISRYFKVTANTHYVSPWKSKGLSAEIIKPPSTSDNSLTPELNYYGTKTRAKFTGRCLKEPKVSYTHRNAVNIYTAYELNASSSHENDPKLKNSLFGEVTLTKNADIDKYGYSGYGIGFDKKSSFSFPGGGFGQNVIIFGADMSSSVHVDNKKKDLSLSLHYNGVNSYLFVNGTEIYRFKAKDSEIVAASLCLGNVSKDWSVDNMKKTGLNGYVFDFSVDYHAVDDILDIQNYLMKKMT